MRASGLDSSELLFLSMVVLIGAEFNSLRNPRFLFGAHSELVAEPSRRQK